MRHGVLVLVLLSACSLQSSLTGGSSSPSGTTMSAPSGAAPSGAGGSDRLVMPNLIGKTPEEANAMLRAAGFATQVEANRRALACVDAAEDPGRINCQDPAPGTSAYRSALVAVTVYQPTTFQGALVRAQLVKVRGMTVDEARAYLRSLGHDGPVEIFESPVPSPTCGDRVCNVSPESGTGLHDRIELQINPR